MVFAPRLSLEHLLFMDSSSFNACLAMMEKRKVHIFVLYASISVTKITEFLIRDSGLLDGLFVPALVIPQLASPKEPVMSEERLLDSFRKKKIYLIRFGGFGAFYQSSPSHRMERGNLLQKRLNDSLGKE